MEVSQELVERVAAACLRLDDERRSEVGIAPFTVPITLEWLTPVEAGAYLRLTPKALEHLRAEGSGPRFHRYSGRVRYNLSDLRAWALAHPAVRGTDESVGS